MRAWILIPCKALAQGKSRLASILSPEDREELCTHLLHRALNLAVSLQSVARVAVITPDPAARAIAFSYGVGTIDDDGSGLNAALRRGRARIISRNGRHPSALILPIDLPYASPDAVRRAISFDLDVVLAPDERRQGTNLLYVGSRALHAFRFAFGQGSFSAHRSWAQQQQLRIAVIEDPLLAFDVDRPEDYARWQGHQREQRDWPPP